MKPGVEKDSPERLYDLGTWQTKILSTVVSCTVA